MLRFLLVDSEQLQIIFHYHLKVVAAFFNQIDIILKANFH
jgi:hypothetical protein